MPESLLAWTSPEPPGNGVVDEAEDHRQRAPPVHKAQTCGSAFLPIVSVQVKGQLHSPGVHLVSSLLSGVLFILLQRETENGVAFKDLGACILTWCSSAHKWMLSLYYIHGFCRLFVYRQLHQD